jgi:hypothetical protein
MACELRFATVRLNQDGLERPERAPRLLGKLFRCGLTKGEDIGLNFGGFWKAERVVAGIASGKDCGNDQTDRGVDVMSKSENPPVGRR